MIADCETCDRKQVPCKSCQESQRAICYRCDGDVDDPYCEAGQQNILLTRCQRLGRCGFADLECICASSTLSSPQGN